MKKFHLLSIILGVVLLIALVWMIGHRELWRELTLLGWGLVPLILIEGVSDIFHTLGWRHCLSGPHRSLPFFRIFSIRLAGFSINYLTPTADVGGEVTKGTLLALNHKGPEAITGVIIGKLSYALTQLLFVGLGSLTVLWGIDLPSGAWMAMLVGSALLGSGILAFLAVQRQGKLGALARWLVAHRVGGKTLKKAADQITQVDEALKLFYREHPMDLAYSMLWHVLGLACGIVQTWYFLYLLTPTPSFVMAAGIWFLGTWFDLVSFPIPQDIGFLEGSRVLVFRALGYESVLGLSFGIALRLEQIFWAGIGLLMYGALLAEKRKGFATEQPSKERG